MITVLILTCSNCSKTSAVEPAIEKVSFPRIETELLWGCVRCNTNHRWLIRKERKVEDTARESLRHSTGHERSRRRKNVYARLREVTDDEKTKILFGEIIWWWRNEAGLGQVEAAAKARITRREWMRIEAGKTLPRQDNLQRIVRAARGRWTRHSWL